MHVVRLPETQDVCPCEQLSVHVSEQAALGAMPEHDFGETHAAVEAA